jgi:hypothetical protein
MARRPAFLQPNLSAVTMTPRFPHLAPSALREAIGLLDNCGQPRGIAAEAAV